MGTVAILGVGLIGGSYGLALKARGLADRVVGWVRSEATAEAALEMGAVDAVTRDAREAVSGAELVILCTPPRRIPEDCAAIADAIRPDAVVTDAASTKGGVVARCEETLGYRAPRFVGGHPMAGSERAGVRNARADLFEGAAYVVTPTARTAPDALETVVALAKSLGARAIRTDPLAHDRAVAYASHLPHVLASALARTSIPDAEARLVHGAGLRDTTRVAAGDPVLWTEILLANRRALGEALASAIEDLAELAALLAEGDEEGLAIWLASAADLRRGLEGSA